MRFHASISFLAGLAGFAGAASAQVTFTGVIEKATLPSICQEETHFLTCTGPSPDAPTGVLLKSSTLDLSSFEGQVATFTAQPRGVTCLIYDITAVDPTPAPTLEMCGTPGLGCPLRFRIHPSSAIGEFWLFLSGSPGFAPIDPVTGTVLLGPGFVLVAHGMTPPGQVDVVVPADPALTGLELWLQGARRDIGPIGPITATNAVCFEIPGFVFVCETPDC
ncbi:MAG: hypothetical protein L0027_14950 [Candidatus Rokubacteria bacterium]|nr:hypothetical protein [Candidatus Rokubacteria bacterium]